MEFQYLTIWPMKVDFPMDSYSYKSANKPYLFLKMGTQFREVQICISYVSYILHTMNSH